jgi:hypothetical protein
MATPRAPANFTMLGVRRRGFETTRSPGVASLGNYGALPTLLGSTGSGLVYVPPIGIPSPPMDVLEELPTLPSPWTTSTAGFYYVRQGGAASGNGTPAAPRGTIPNPIPAGSVVVLDNTANFAVSNYSLTISGTSGQRCWLVGAQQYGLGSGSTQAQIRHSSSASVTSTYAVIDGVDFLTTGTNDLWGFFPRNTLYRNCTWQGDATQRTGNNAHSLSGASTSNRAEDSVLYNCVVRDSGLWTFDSGNDTDVHGLQLGRFISRLWILDSQFYHNQGDGIQCTGNGSPSQNTATDVDHVYVGRNVFYENLQTGSWWKLGVDCIVSDNTFYNFTDGGGSAPVATGGQYDFINRIWWLRNRIYDCSGGIRIAGDFNGNVPGRDIYVLGNIITNCSATNGTVQTGSPFSDGCAIACWQSVDLWIAFNTIWNFAGHGIGIVRSSSSPIIENNIIQGRLNSACYDLFHENTSGGLPNVRNNQFPASPRFNVNAAATTTLAAFQSADSSRRTNNRSSATGFVNAVTGSLGDFRLQAGDGAIDAGALTTDVFAIFQALYGIDIRKDFLEVTRPQGTFYDIGAYERVV